MDILVTGGAGFIGSHVCARLLQDGHAVWAFDDLNDFYDPDLKRSALRDLQASARPFTFVFGDLTDRNALDELFASARFDQVIHLAARAGVRPSLEEPALYQRVNVEGTVNILEAARARNVRKVTIASSSSVYGVNAKVPFVKRFQDVSERLRFLRALDHAPVTVCGQEHYRYIAMAVNLLRRLNTIDSAGQVNVHQHQCRKVPASQFDRLLAGCGGTGHAIAHSSNFAGEVFGDDTFVFDNQNGVIVHE